MASVTWIGGTGNWTTGADWSTGTPPASGDDAIILFGTISLTTPVTVNSITLSTGSGKLLVADPGQTDTVSTTLSNSGTVSVDASSSGSTLSIGGALSNSGTFNIGSSTVSSASTVDAGSLSNTGTINVTGNGSNQAALDIAAAAPTTLTGTYDFQGDALLEFGSGAITAIGSSGNLTVGSQSGVDISSNSASNSALTGLVSNAGTLNLGSALTMASGTNFTNTGTFNVTGTGVTLGGTLNNSGAINVRAANQVGNQTPSMPATLTVNGLNNTGVINIYSLIGRFGGGPPAQATVDMMGPAPSVLTGSIEVDGDALLEFASGSVNTIASGASLVINSFSGAVAQVIGLSGLTTNAGTLLIDPSQIELGNGGTQLTLSGSLSNTGTIAIGNSQLNVGAADLTVGGLANTGTITLQGGIDQATLIVQSAAPPTLTGSVSVGLNSLLEYASGGIAAIGSGASLTLDSNGVVALSSNTGGSTALTGLASNAGALILEGDNLVTNTGVDFTNTGSVDIEQGVLALGGSLSNNSGDLVTIQSQGELTAASLGNAGTINLITEAIPGFGNATLAVSGNAANAGILSVDGTKYSHGSTFQVGGYLTNTGTFTLGNSHNDNNIKTVAGAGGVANTGTITMVGAGSAQMATFTASGAISNSGIISIGQFAALDVTGGDSFTQTGGSTTVDGGALSASQVDVGGGTLLFETVLTSSAGTGAIDVNGSGLVEFASSADSSETVSFEGSGTLKLDDAGQYAGTIGGFTASGDVVDLTSLGDASNNATTSFNSTNDQLTVTTGSGSVTLQLASMDYGGVAWTASQDQAGGTAVTAGPSAIMFSFAAAEPVNIAATPDGGNLPAPVEGDFNLEEITAPSGTDYPTPSGYQGVALSSGRTLTLLHGDYGGVDATTGGAETIIAGDGNDTINALVGNDTVETGSGSATVFGSAGDLIEAGAGNAYATDEGGGNPIILTATNGAALLYDGGGDTLAGGAAATTVIGAAGDNFSLGAGADTLNALAGNETITFGSGDATVFGGAGDTIGSATGTDIVVNGGSNAVIAVETGGSVLINSGPGDTLTGGAAPVQIIGAAGDDIALGTGADTVNALPVNETVTFGSGDATVYGGVGDTIGSAAGTDVVFNGGNNAIVVVQTGGSAVVYSGAGDTLTGGTAAAQIIGVGNDAITLGAGADTVNALAGNQSVILGNAAGSGTVYGASGDAFTTGMGSDYVDFISGHAGTETLAPGSGNDTAGNDTVYDFNQAQGDRIEESSQAETNTLASAHQNGGGTVITLSDGSTVTLAGITSIDSSFFA